MVHLETITPTMHSIAKELFPVLPPHFYLVGGTALALLIGHRESIDLDYFTPNDIDTVALFTDIVNALPERQCLKTFEAPNTLWISIDGIKLSFIKRKQPLLEEVIPEGAFRLASLADITIMKLAAICGRDEYKDYFDLSYLAEKTDVRCWPSWWIEVSPESDALSWLVALAHVSEVTEMSLKGARLKSKSQVESGLRKTVQEINKYLHIV
jgi:hypothetical protein